MSDAELLRRLLRIQDQLLLDGERASKLSLSKSKRLRGDAVVNPFTGSICFAADLRGASDRVLTCVLAHELGHREDMLYRALCWSLPLYLVGLLTVGLHHQLAALVVFVPLCAAFLNFTFQHRERRADENAVRRLKLVGSRVDYWQADAEYQSQFGNGK